MWEWKRRLEGEGEEALQARPRPKRKRRLSEEQQQRLSELLLQGPRAAGFPTELWTLKRVAQVIEREFGIRYHPAHVWRILRAMGFSYQKPERRARERDEEAIRRWRKMT